MKKTGYSFAAGLLLSVLLGITTPAIAHQVEVSGNVGGTAHIEPNDNPKAGTPSLTWFALTRAGGEIIPLADCDCRLSVYTQPRQPDDAPIQQPSLQPVSAEGYRDVPGANITFPQVGAYELVLQGEPTRADDFSPFELTFGVTVAVGQTASPAPAATPENEAGSIATPAANSAPENPNWLLWIVPVGVLAIGLLLLAFRSRK